MAPPVWRYPYLPEQKTGAPTTDRVLDLWRNVLNANLRVGTSSIQGIPVPPPTSANDQQALLYNAATNAFIYAGSGGGVLPAPGASGNVLTSNGSIWQSSAPGITVPVPVNEGGTGATTASGARTNLSAAKSGANSDITSLTGLTTPLPVTEGGIGAATLTADAVLLGNGTSALQTVAPGSSGNVLTSNGTTWVSSAAAPAGQVNLLTYGVGSSVYNDEFTSTTISSQWTLSSGLSTGTANVLSPSSSSPNAIYDLNSWGSWFLLQGYPGGSFGSVAWFITESVTLPTDCVWFWRIKLTGSGNGEPYSYFRFQLQNGGDVLSLAVGMTSGGPVATFTSTLGGWSVTSQLNGTIYITAPFYLAIVKSGSTWSGFWSLSDAGNWTSFFSTDWVYQSDSTVYNTATLVWVNSGAGSSPAAPVCGIDFIRMLPNTTQLPGGG